MKKCRGFTLVLTMVCATACANLQTVVVTPDKQKELGLEFDLSLKHLTENVVQVRLTAEKRGKLKDFSFPSVVIPANKGSNLDVPVAAEPVLTNSYSFLLNPTQVSNTRLHLHCLTGGSAEIRYELNLHDYAVKQGIAQMERNAYDYLPFLTGERSNRARMDKLRESSEAKVSTIKQAEEAAINFQVAHGGLDARDGIRVVGLFPLAADVEDLGKGGELIWAVKILRFGVTVSNEIWVNSQNGKALAMIRNKATLP